VSNWTLMNTCAMDKLEVAVFFHCRERSLDFILFFFPPHPVPCVLQRVQADIRFSLPTPRLGNHKMHPKSIPRSSAVQPSASPPSGLWSFIQTGPSRRLVFFCLASVRHLNALAGADASHLLSLNSPPSDSVRSCPPGLTARATHPSLDYFCYVLKPCRISFFSLFFF